MLSSIAPFHGKSRIKRDLQSSIMCSSKKYPYPLPSRRATEIQRGISEGLGDGFSRSFSRIPNKTGELSKTNNHSVEQTFSYFIVDDLLIQELWFSALTFH